MSTFACKHGHPWTEENTHIDPRGFKRCRSCARERMQARKLTETRKNFRCEICGREVWVQPSSLGRRRFCSHACANSAPDVIEKKRDREGRKNPGFKHGRKVGENIRGWGVLFKGEDCCRICGSTESLHLHHMIPRSKSRASRRDLRNGMTLCGSCHSKWHAHSLIIYRDLITDEEWEYLSSVELTGHLVEAWLDDHYPPRPVISSPDA